MNLCESILSGVQSWYKATVKNLTRARNRQKNALGWKLDALGYPSSLSEARGLLFQFCDLSSGSEEKRARALLRAIESAESREGVSTDRLVESLMQQEITLEDSVQHRMGYPLGPSLER